MADIHDEGKQYWTIIRRVRQHNGRPMIMKAATNELSELATTTKSEAIKRRCLQWLALNQKHSPGNGGGSSGPRHA